MKPNAALRQTLTRWALFLSLLFLLLGGGGVGLRAFDQAQDLQDDTLEEIARLISTGHIYPHRAAEQTAPTDELDEETITLQELGKPGPLASLPAELATGLHTLRLNGKEWRLIIVTQPSSHRRFAVAQQTELRNQIAWGSTLSVLIPMAAFIFALLLVIPLVIWRQFHPLEQLAKRLTRAQSTALEPIPEQNLPQEIIPFVQAINQLLARTQTTLDKQHRFIADAAHELRTPIAALTLQAENLANAPTETERVQRQQALRQGLERLKVLVVQLLDLARLQNETARPKSLIALHELVSQTVVELHPLAEAAGVDLGVTQLTACTIDDQEGRIGQLIRIALANAINHTPAGGQIDIALCVTDQTALIDIDDTGCGIPDAEIDRVMQPFYRGQRNEQPGNGLGLAIAAEIAERIGGSIRLSNRPSGGLRFRYTQPLATQSPV